LLFESQSKWFSIAKELFLASKDVKLKKIMKWKKKEIKMKKVKIKIRNKNIIKK
jgi:hypothetical protein